MATMKMPCAVGTGSGGAGFLITIVNPSAFNGASSKTISTNDFSGYSNVLIYGMYNLTSSGIDNRWATVITDFQRGVTYKVKLGQKSGQSEEFSRDVTFNATNNTITFGHGYYNGTTVRDDMGFIERIVFFNDSQSITIS